MITFVKSRWLFSCAKFWCVLLFKKRRHSYKAALAVEIRLRVIATDFVVLRCSQAALWEKKAFWTGYPSDDLIVTAYTPNIVTGYG